MLSRRSFVLGSLGATTLPLFGCGSGSGSGSSDPPKFTAQSLQNPALFASVALTVSGTRQAGFSLTMNVPLSQRATLWNRSATDYTDLHPAGYGISAIYGADENHQVGYGDDYALLWNGSATSAINLHPFSLLTSQGRSLALATHNGIQGGYGAGGSVSPDHALLWRGTPESVVDLHPLNLDMLKSFVIGVHGDQQVGVGFTIGGGVLIDSPPPAVYALLWRGTADSVLNLNPVGYLRSRALATSGKQQVGWASKLFYHGGGPDFPIFSAEPIPIGDEAILWSGTAESAITLHPSSWGYSRAYGVANGEQVGYGGGHSSADEVHALHWRGSAESVIDLHTFLPPEYSESFARGINDNGDVVGGAILRSNPQQFQAVLWKRQ